jgi:heme-degrading monooxygenase HmoA
MLARVSTIEGEKDQIDRGIDHYREQVLPAVRKMAGFKGAYLFVDRKSGRSVGITLWDTETNLQASNASADKLRAQANKITDALKPPVVEIFEVAIQP